MAFATSSTSSLKRMLRFLLPVEFRADRQVFPRLLLPECNVLSQRIGANIAAPLNAWSDYQPIRFIDALDRRREISFEWCEMWRYVILI